MYIWKFNFLNFDNRTASSHRKWSKMHRNGLTFENGYFVHVLWHKTYDIFGEHPHYYKIFISIPISSIVTQVPPKIRKKNTRSIVVFDEGVWLRVIPLVSSPLGMNGIKQKRKEIFSPWGKKDNRVHNGFWQKSVTRSIFFSSR